MLRPTVAHVALTALLALALSVLAAVVHAQPPEAVARIWITPAQASLNVGETVRFRAAGKDKDGRPVSFVPTWHADGGVIDARGEFRATAPGHYTVSASTADGRSTGTAEVVVHAQRLQLTSLEVLPRTVRLLPGEQKRFIALLRDRDGRPREAAPVWSASGGAIDTQGLFTAGNAPGRFRITAYDRRTRQEASAEVVVVGR